MLACIRLKICKCLTCRRIIGIYRINMRILIYLRKPLRCFFDHPCHMLIIRTKHDIFPIPTFHMFSENIIQSIRILQCTAQSLQLFLSFITDGLIFCLTHPFPVFLHILLVRVDRQYILRRIQDSPYDCLSKSHFRGNISIK